MECIGGDKFKFSWHITLSRSQLETMGVIGVDGTVWQEKVYEMLGDFFDDSGAERDLMSYLGAEEQEDE